MGGRIVASLAVLAWCAGVLVAPPPPGRFVLDGGSMVLSEARPGRQPPGLSVQIRLPAAQPARAALAA
jgi:hypothetical protein